MPPPRQRDYYDDNDSDWLFLGFLICITVIVAFVAVGLSLGDRHGLRGFRVDEQPGHRHKHQDSTTDDESTDDDYQYYSFHHGTTDYAEVSPPSYESAGLLCSLTNVNCSNYQWYKIF